MTTVGYIGLGMMGSAMVERLCDRGPGGDGESGNAAQVWVYDVNEAAVETAVELGAQRADSAAEIADRCEVISVCVPAAEHVLSVVGELVAARSGHQGASAHTTVVVHSTVHPDTMQEAAALAGTAGLALFDACVAGGDEAARSGELVIFAGGGDAMSPAAHQLLTHYGTKVIQAGPLGSGAALKLAVNVMTYAQFAAASMAFDLVTESGGNPDALFEAWRHTGMLGTLTERFSALLAIPPEHLNGGLRTMLENQAGIARKDLGLAAELATTPEATSLLSALTAAMADTYGVADPTDEAPTP